MTRQQRLADTLCAIRSWHGATGPARLRARRDAVAAVAEFKRYHLAPERAAFEAAVASKQRGRIAA